LQSWDSVRALINAGRVLIDKCFIFPDGNVKPKHILILSDNIVEESYIYCLTTSQTGTYRGSYAEYIECNDLAFGNKQIIIEIERIDIINLKLLEKKYRRKELVIKGKIKQDLLSEIMSRIEESERIPMYYKEWLGLI
jgi:hypothetical protein